MLRSQLRDAAISAAKAHGHERVEPRHVWFAIAKRFRQRPDAGALLDAARRALEPRGSAHAAPELAPEAAQLLESIGTEKQAVDALVAALKAGRAKEGEEAGGQARQSVEAQAVPAEAAAKTTAKPAESTSDVLAELDGLIGLAPVKEQVRKVIAVVQANTERVKAGLTPVNPSLHLVFTGPPGTGKTTVARLVARLYASTGALPGSGFTEATRADLIAGYVGQTALKTAEVIRKTRPGVLFIDEAYALAPTSDVDFGAEAIATLVKAMEDHRDDFAVIVAGYSEEMGVFVGSNPGLRSRFKTYIDFPDYSADDLLLIFERFVLGAKIALARGAREKAREVMAEAVEQPDFGNARFARSLFEGAYARMAARAAADGRVEVTELGAITPDDIVLDLDKLREERRRIGFH